jgi:hypothetical protein
MTANDKYISVAYLRRHQASDRLYRNIGFLLITLPLIMVAGFWIPYISGFPKFDPSITIAVHIHAALLFTWVVLLVVQPLAIRWEAFALHRLLGKGSLVLMPLIVFFAATMIWMEYRERIAGGVSPMAAMEGEYLSAVQLALIIIFFLLAIDRIRKQKVAAHMRFMICIALVLLPAGLARTLGFWFGLPQALSQAISLGSIDACILMLIAYDKYRHLSPRPYFLALAAYVLIEAVWISIGHPV